MSTSHDFQNSYSDELVVTVLDLALHRNAIGSTTAITDVITGSTVLETHLGLIGRDYPRRKRAQRIDVTLSPYEDLDQLQQEWQREREFYLESAKTSEWDVQFSDSMQKLLKEGRMAAAAFDDDPPTAGIYYKPEDNLGPPVIPERWGMYCRISRSVLSALAEDIRSGLPISLEVEMRLKPLLWSHDRESLGLLPYSEHSFNTLGWLRRLEWIIKSRRPRVRTNPRHGE